MNNDCYNGNQLLKSLQVMQLCLDACTKGSIWQRNPYLRSSKVKQNLAALHQSIERVIVDSLAFSAEVSREGHEAIHLHRYFKSYAFLFEFNDGIKKEEYDHRILIRDKSTLLKFSNLQYQSRCLVKQLQMEHRKESS